MLGQDISTFMDSIGRPKMNMDNCNMLLTSMLTYDDCAAVPALKTEYFENDVTIFAKKHNLVGKETR
jgi:hypothetical protein